MDNQEYDVIVIGAGAAGLFFGWQAGVMGARVLVLDHAKKIGEKIRISGGGRCNFTNLHCAPEHFLSNNPHFCKSALKGFGPRDFLDLVEAHGIAWHEKKLGQLFCDQSAQQIIDMLVDGCHSVDTTIKLETVIDSIDHTDQCFTINTIQSEFNCKKLVVATGGLSIPKIGASGFGYDIARQFGHKVVPTRAALVPLTFSDGVRDQCKALSGLSVEADICYGKTHFTEGMLFTHRGLSGPSILQISSYWDEGQELCVDLAHGHDVLSLLKQAKTEQAKQDIRTVLGGILPKKLAEWIVEDCHVSGRIADLSDKALAQISERVQCWRIKPNGTEGYRTAEVTLGGVDTDGLSSKTMESCKQEGLYFIGEVVDVTGQLGGFNFQWAWSSAYAAAKAVSN